MNRKIKFMRSMLAPANPKDRITAMLRDYDSAPNDADITVRTGDFGGEPAIIIGIGDNLHGVTVSEVEPTILIAEHTAKALNAIGVESDFSNLILAMRHGATIAMREFSTNEQ